MEIPGGAPRAGGQVRCIEKVEAKDCEYSCTCNHDVRWGRGPAHYYSRSDDRGRMRERRLFYFLCSLLSAGAVHTEGSCYRVAGAYSGRRGSWVPRFGGSRARRQLLSCTTVTRFGPCPGVFELECRMSTNQSACCMDGDSTQHVDSTARVQSRTSPAAPQRQQADAPADSSIHSCACTGGAVSEQHSVVSTCRGGAKEGCSLQL
jgi:hypothetical protein